MKYHVTVRGHTYVIDVEGGAVTVDGDRLEAHWTAIPGSPLIHLLLAKDSWTVASQQLDASGKRWALSTAGERLEAEVQDDRTKQIDALTGRGAREAPGGIIRAPMPGLIVRVEVTVGQEVAAGTGVVVVEAMKMENELRAARPGRVAEVGVAEGASVEAGRLLVVVE